jgi:hypothetical protein
LVRRSGSTIPEAGHIELDVGVSDNFAADMTLGRNIPDLLRAAFLAKHIWDLKRRSLYPVAKHPMLEEMFFVAYRTKHLQLYRPSVVESLEPDCDSTDQRSEPGSIAVRNRLLQPGWYTFVAADRKGRFDAEVYKAANVVLDNGSA